MDVHECELQLVLAKFLPSEKKVEDASESMQDKLTRTNERNLDSVRHKLTNVSYLEDTGNITYLKERRVVRRHSPLKLQLS